MNQKDALRFYEQVLVLHPSCEEQEQKSLCKSVVNIIEESKGSMFCVNTWGSRAIANPKAKKVTRGFYFYMLFSATPGVIQKLRKQLSMESKMLYFHQERLPKKTTPEQHTKEFLQGLEQTMEKETERLAKIQKKQNFNNRA